MFFFFPGWNKVFRSHAGEWFCSWHQKKRKKSRCAFLWSPTCCWLARHFPVCLRHMCGAQNFNLWCLVFFCRPGGELNVNEEPVSGLKRLLTEVGQLGASGILFRLQKRTLSKCLVGPCEACVVSYMMPRKIRFSCSFCKCEWGIQSPGLFSHTEDPQLAYRHAGEPLWLHLCSCSKL